MRVSFPNKDVVFPCNPRVLADSRGFRFLQEKEPYKGD